MSYLDTEHAVQRSAEESDSRAGKLHFSNIGRSSSYFAANSSIIPAPDANAASCLGLREATRLTVNDITGIGLNGTLSSAALWT